MVLRSIAIDNTLVKRLLSSLLLVGALLGLFGAQMAYARSVPPIESAPMAMDADCMAMMAKQQPAPKHKPCNGLTLECIAAMGCVVPLIAADLAGGVAAPRIYGSPSFWPTTTVLASETIAPDPEPPTTLG